jgi:zinc protease
MGLMAFQDLLYGVGSPYSHFVSEQSLKKILQRELRLFARRFVRPNGAILAVSGSLSMEEFQKVVNQELGGWERRAEPLPIIPPSTHVPKPGVYVLERDFDQATILLGQPGPPRLTADRYDIAVFNRYFSFSGFGSVLFGEIRSRLGLAYSIDGGFFPRAQAGDFRVMLATRVTEAERATREVLRLIEQCRKERPASGRLEEIKLAATNSFIFNFVKPGQIANRAALLELFGFPKDADQVYVERISQVAPEGVQSVAERRIAPEQMVVVIVGRVKPELLTLPNVYRLGFDTEPRVLGKVSRLRGDWDK